MQYQNNDLNQQQTDSFDNYLKWASETVHTWPEWKQNILGSPVLKDKER